MDAGDRSSARRVGAAVRGQSHRTRTHPAAHRMPAPRPPLPTLADHLQRPRFTVRETLNFDMPPSSNDVSDDHMLLLGNGGDGCEAAAAVESCCMSRTRSRGAMAFGMLPASNRAALPNFWMGACVVGAGGWKLQVDGIDPTHGEGRSNVKDTSNPSCVWIAARLIFAPHGRLMLKIMHSSHAPPDSILLL